MLTHREQNVLIKSNCVSMRACDFSVGTADGKERLINSQRGKKKKSVSKWLQDSECRSLDQGVSTSALWTFGAGACFAVGAVCCRMSSSIPGVYSLDASRTHPESAFVRIKNVAIDRRAKSKPLENSCFRWSDPD